MAPLTGSARSENERAWTLSLGSPRSARCTTSSGISAAPAALLTMIPIVALFLLAQMAFVPGVTLTGVKG